MDGFLNQIPQLVEDGLGIDAGQILIQLIATSILFLIVFKFLWKPITELLEERSAIIQNDINEAKHANEDAQAIKDEMTEELAQAKLEAKQIIEASRERGDSERERIVQEANAEIKQKFAKAEEEIEREVEKAKDGLKEEIVDVAFQVAEKIMQKEIAKNAHDKDIDDYLKEVKK